MGTLTNLNSGVAGLQFKVVNTTVPAAASNLVSVDLNPVFGAGFDFSRIRAVSAIATLTSGSNSLRFPPGGIGLAGYSYFLSLSNNFVVIRTTTDSGLVLGLPARVIIWHE
ncbi:MAG: hypothetical protein JGK17_06190 [Microcoleus sp. PH2017_10_PVI_O_A]|uniref:hypothetical protein n=1 Tax=unclassified Microcoleus TaxID=2642155 RepID=UPI001D6D0310|nr:MULTISPECIES: hypothetical protein [unclassified Microcoleus]TAE84477.1 MAG: hypothetical protein EAZ83_05835 [Oscillatoriales cyanobacterium]MCC3405176.1 hypothetical protein [Microcoleus sp. PH2017_10_PVI_O_A]MCC3459263.1 hypothetical protein [Microcoleus sp. PH2017_11_PCY_U_A]MCC3477422.1 hypothetical protein [Microcoleus sp. PH2017_12_PCY_D_A]MCC3558515.1 hypothetical protein [Microcoleus sp. PH2017_27_LUM_O_A]